MPAPIITSRFELAARHDGVCEIWRVDGSLTEIVGEVRVTGDGIEIAIGDVEPAEGAVMAWTGEPFVMRLKLGRAPQ